MDVLLKRDFRTPVGRFAKSVDGVPTQIPKRVMDRWPLPKDAVVVDKNYKSPHQIRKELGRDPDADAPKMSAAQMEAEIEDRVNARLQALERGDPISKEKDADPEHRTSGAKALAKKKREDAQLEAKRIHDDAEKQLDKMDKEDGSAPAATDADADADTSSGNTLLDNSVADIVPELKDMDEQQLQTLLADEQAGKTRTTLVAEIEAAIEDLRQE